MTLKEKQEQDFALKRKTFRLSVFSAILYFLALLLSFYSAYTARSLFYLQNRPYIDISKFASRGMGCERCEYTYNGVDLTILNTGNLPGVIEKLWIQLNYQGLRKDTTLALNIKLFPKESENIDISNELDHFMTQFIINVDSLYTAHAMDYTEKLRFAFEIIYSCPELEKSYSEKSIWQHDPKNEIDYVRSVY